MFCSQCGRPAHPEDRFCGGCGSHARQANAEIVPPANAQLQPHRGENRFPIIALTAVPLFVLLLVIAAVHNITLQGKPPVGERDNKTESVEAVRPPVALKEEQKVIAAQIGREERQPHLEPASIQELSRETLPIVAQGWANTSVLGFKAGESAGNTELHARALGLTQIGDCKFRKDAAGFTDCRLSGPEGESMDEALYDGYLQGFRYNFRLNRYDEILGEIKSTHGTPRILVGPHGSPAEVSNEWGGPSNRFSISLNKKDVGGDTRKTIDGGRTWEHVGLASVLVVFDIPQCVSGHECFVPTQELIGERQRIVRRLRWAEDMLKAPAGFAARAQLYCRGQMIASGLRSVEELERLYAQLMQAEPSTREEEEVRQRKLYVYREAIGDASRNENGCRGMLLNGLQKLPTDEEERDKASQARGRIAEIDQELARRK